jgi:DNA-binding transcriptional ArsR family regulator
MAEIEVEENGPNDSEEADIPPMNKIFQNDLRFQMWGLFSMFPELTLSDLSDLLGKSKSTIHPHLKLLEKMEIIEMVRREKVRGSIKSKIYSLKKGYDEKISKAAKNCKQKTHMDKEYAKQIAEGHLASARIRKKNIETEIEFWEKVLASGLNGPDEKAVKMLSEMIPVGEDAEEREPEFTHSFGYLDKDTFHAYRSKTSQVIRETSKLSHEAEKNNPTLEKPYFIYTQGLPMKKIIQYLHPAR